MAIFLVAVISGLAVGGVYVLVAMGMVLGIRCTRTLNFAQGYVMLFAAFIVGWLEVNRHWPVVLDLLIALVGSSLITMLFYRTALKRMVGGPPFLGLLCTLGLAFVLTGAIAIPEGANEYVVNIPGVTERTLTIDGARIAENTLVIAGVTFFLAIVLALCLEHTHPGTKMKAAGQDAILAAQGGINIEWTYLIGWTLAGLFAGIAGVAYGNLTLAAPTISNIAFIALPAMVIGGMDSIVGALVGGLIMGLLEGLIATYIGSSAVDAYSYIALLIVLLLRPQGFFGTRDVQRA